MAIQNALQNQTIIEGGLIVNAAEAEASQAHANRATCVATRTSTSRRNRATLAGRSRSRAWRSVPTHAGPLTTCVARAPAGTRFVLPNIIFVLVFST